MHTLISRRASNSNDASNNSEAKGNRDARNSNDAQQPVNFRRNSRKIDRTAKFREKIQRKRVQIYKEKN
jgi:hypothetical protein